MSETALAKSLSKASRGQEAGARIEHAARVERFQRALEALLERLLADQGRGIGDDLLRLAADDFQVGEIVVALDAGEAAGDDHRQVAEARVLGQHREEGVGDARAETFAEDDAVDVADVEMFCAGLDAERADNAHLLSERNRERGVGCAAPDQERRRIVQRIGLGKD